MENKIESTTMKSCRRPVFDRMKKSMHRVEVKRAAVVKIVLASGSALDVYL